MFKTLRGSHIITDKNVPRKLSQLFYFYFKDVFSANKNMKTNIWFIIIIIITSF